MRGRSRTGLDLDQSGSVAWRAARQGLAFGSERGQATSPPGGTHRASPRCPNVNTMIGVFRLHRVVTTAPTERSDMSTLPTRRLSVVTTLAAMTAAAAFTIPATAAPVTPAAMSSVARDISVAQGGTAERVQYRGRHWRGGLHGRRHWRHGGWQRRHWGHRRGYGYRRYGYGPAIVGGIASAIIGGSIVASQRSHGDAWQRCDARYKSFRWSDGTFQPYGDEPRQLCPYLTY